MPRCSRRRENRSDSQVDLAELQAARERLLQELGQARDRSAELEARLAGEQERTTLAQRELEQRDVRIEELLRSAGRTEEALATEQALSREALNQVDTLNRQINALRVQLASLEQALDLEQQKVEEQQVTIADLGSKLNMALAGKVEELSRFRSEFFGRLRELIGERQDIRVVGDRFVFQSEVLFPTASADIEPGGMEELSKLATACARSRARSRAICRGSCRSTVTPTAGRSRPRSTHRTGNCPRRGRSTSENSWCSMASARAHRGRRICALPAAG